MPDALLHVKIDSEIKDEMKKLIQIGIFETEAEIAREAIRTLIVDIKDEKAHMLLDDNIIVK